MKMNFSNLHRNLIVISVIAVLIIIVRQFILYDVPEFFSLGQELGELLFNLCVGYLVTFWFYYLTVYRRESKYKIRVQKYVEVFVEKTVNAYDSLITNLVETNQHKLQEVGVEPYSKEGFKILFRLTEMNGFSPLLDRNFIQMTWAEYIKTQRNQIDKNLRECSIVFQHLDPDEINVITELISHELLEVLNNIPIEKFESIEAFSDLFFDMGEKIRNLEKAFLTDNKQTE